MDIIKSRVYTAMNHIHDELSRSRGKMITEMENLSSCIVLRKNNGYESQEEEEWREELYNACTVLFKIDEMIKDIDVDEIIKKVVEERKENAVQ